MRLLIADEDRFSRQAMETHLGKCGHDVVVCSEGNEAWNILHQADAPQLAVLDWMMPGRNGIEICRKLRDMANEKYTYIILLASSKGPADVVDAFNAGADDYVPKPFDPGELQMRVRVGVRLIQLQADLRSALRRSEFKASHDTLSGLWNRGAIVDTLEEELARGRRQMSAVSIVLADLDFFKRINDRYGHAAGDAVIRRASARLAAGVRPYDSIGRYGGEEFLIVLPGCDTKNACKVATRLRKEFEENPICTSEGVFPVTLSLGVASANPGQEFVADDLIRHADAALYRAKEKGRNRVEWDRQPEEAPFLWRTGETTFHESGVILQ